MTVQYPVINGQRCDFSSIETDVNGVVQSGYKEISYSHKLDPGKLRGTSPEVLGRTTGEYSAEGSLTLYLAEWEQLRESLAPGYMVTSFDTTVAYNASGEPLQVDELIGCRITNVEKQHSQGTDPLTVKLTLDILKVIEDGDDPLPPGVSILD